MLAYDENSSRNNTIKRETFEKHLQVVGLQLEKEENQRIHFVKIHVPKDILCQYAEVLKLRLPIKEVRLLGYAFEFAKSLHYRTLNST